MVLGRPTNSIPPCQQQSNRMSATKDATRGDPHGEKPRTSTSQLTSTTLNMRARSLSVCALAIARFADPSCSRVMVRGKREDQKEALRKVVRYGAI